MVFHVAAKVFEKTKTLSPTLCSSVMRGLSDPHYTTSKAEFLTMQKRFTKVWLASHSWRWHIYHTPPAFATTNNPVESFNGTLKRDYTLRKYLEMGSLVWQLMASCQNKSTTSKPFSVDPTSIVTLVLRPNENEKSLLSV
ncbi:hypothetical protein PHMEG_0002597 [Phytophthora megakarya]|uniref:Uncharacterized protein n=1 Tax=Phytophthora megakarya TaxID=4795 RepID=A0A225WYN0_9STRA|nr:hypothetical protein PHMEG_0002597 [Phytophthora megakarya]